jgi:hypothetical protein
MSSINGIEIGEIPTGRFASPLPSCGFLSSSPCLTPVYNQVSIQAVALYSVCLLLIGLIWGYLRGYQVGKHDGYFRGWRIGRGEVPALPKKGGYLDEKEGVGE